MEGMHLWIGHLSKLMVTVLAILRFCDLTWGSFSIILTQYFIVLRFYYSKKFKT